MLSKKKKPKINNTNSFKKLAISIYIHWGLDTQQLLTPQMHSLGNSSLWMWQKAKAEPVQTFFDM